MKTSSDEIVICFSDLKRLFYRMLPQVKRGGLVGACAIFLLLLVKEPRFLAEATFKQAASVHESGSQLKELFQTVTGNSNQEMGTVSLMTSRAVLRDVVEELGLQVKWDRHFRITKLLGRICENIGLEIGCSLSDVERFAFRSVRYEAETKKTLFIKVLSERSFQLFDEQRNLLGKWDLNEPIFLPFFSGCLTKIPSYAKNDQTYRLQILPWMDAVQAVRSRFTVKSLRSERRLFALTFADRDRFLAAQFLNQVMASCQKVILNENEEIASAQLAYLEKRQNELSRKWDSSLQEHVAYLNNNIHEGGYLSFSQELDYLQQPQNLYSTRLLDVDFELKRLESQSLEDEKEKCNPFLHIPAHAQTTPLLLEKQKQEIAHKLIALELDEKSLPPVDESVSDSQWGISNEIHLLSQQQREAGQLLEQLEQGQELSLLNDPKSLVAIWGKQMAAQQRHLAKETQEKNRLLLGNKEQLAAHLRGFMEQTADKIKLLHDNLAVHRSTSHEFAGLTLETAQQLYLDYNNQRDGLQGQLKQLIYLSEQLYQPQFELSSITTILTDPVTQGLVLEAGDTAVRLQDANNRSLREQDHLKETLNTQKAFISQHLLQIIELTKLRAKLAEDKISSLRTTTMGLLKHEKELLQQQLDQISRQMETLPEKWRRENMLMLKKELGMQMVEGLTHLMESKSIDRHLYQVGSKPLDSALPPVQPKAPDLLMYALLGSILGAFATYFFYLSRSLVNGVPVSHETLALSGFNSCGTLSTYSNTTVEQLPHADLETLRRLAQFLLNLNQKGICCAILGGKNADFSPALAELLAMQQQRVLVVQYVFDKPVSPNQIPGLWHYLHAEVPTCPIRQQGSFDFLPSGGTSRHAVELLSNPQLTSFLASARSTYDVILFYTTAQPSDVEGEALLNIADAAIIATNGEKKGDLFIYQAWSAVKQKECVAFVDLYTSAP